ncbi:MAG: EamA family transporter [Nitrospirae bacterium]|nr:EamA family transporter [Nitrospirota bacterium]
MLWVIYALLTAIMFATSDALTKRALASRDEYFVAWARLVFAFPILLVSLIFTEIPVLDKTFWTATLTALPLEIIAIVLYTKALKVSPLSLTVPFLAFTPLFLIFFSYIILGERISIGGGIGIILIVIGSYLLNFQKTRLSFTEPFRAILKEPGSRLMIIVAIIYSLTSSLGKMAIEHSSPIFFGSLYFMLMTVLFTPIAISKNQRRISITKKDLISLLPIGFTYSLMIIFHMLAMSMTKVSYMISVKRTSLLFSVIYGYFLFKEESLAERLTGCIIMLAGVTFIVLSR